MMMGALLVQNTAWTNVEIALTQLKRSGVRSPAALLRIPLSRLEDLARSSGYFRQKARKLRILARALVEDPAFFRQLQGKAPGDPAELRRRLLALHGVGPETADSILLYAAHHPVFVVDAYTRRWGNRMGLFGKRENYNEVQRFFEKALPADTALFQEYHALIVRLCKTVCTKRAPACPRCPVASQCRQGRR